MLTYEQSTGKLTDGKGLYVGRCYSGHGVGLNQPAYQQVPNVGPIPQGRYSIGEPFTSSRTGPYVLALTAQDGTNTFGRSAFEMHGDSREHTGEFVASHGCIVTARNVRERVAKETDKTLEVIA